MIEVKGDRLIQCVSIIFLIIIIFLRCLCVHVVPDGDTLVLIQGEM